MIELNELNQKAMGGTELMQHQLVSRLGDKLNEFQIIASRVRDIDSGRIPILWLHDLAEDPEVRHLAEASLRERLAKLVFVSNWQFTSYQKVLGIPYDCSKVLLNAIEPIEQHVKDKNGPIRLIYHTTPHRGLQLLYPVYDLLSKKYGDRLHLDVYSSFKIYGWEQRDEQYRDLFEALKAHPHITYHGSVSNSEIREALKKAHIFAYPCIWPETSCIAAIEALSARCLVVCPSYAALPETTGRFAYMYPWTTDLHVHANRFANVLKDAIDEQLEMRENNLDSPTLAMQKIYADSLYSWDNREKEWETLLRSIKDELSS